MNSQYCKGYEFKSCTDVNFFRPYFHYCLSIVFTAVEIASIFKIVFLVFIHFGYCLKLFF